MTPVRVELFLKPMLLFSVPPIERERGVMYSEGGRNANMKYENEDGRNKGDV